MFGSLALVLLNLPIPGYSQWVRTVFDGQIAMAALGLFHATMGILALVLITSVSYSYGQTADPANTGCYPLTCLVSYAAFVVDPNDGLGFAMLGANWLFTAVLVTLCTCSLLRMLLGVSQRWHNKHYHEGIDLDFQSVIVSLLPIAGCVFTVLMARAILTALLGSINLQNVGSLLFTGLFEEVGTGMLGSFLFIFLIHILWFFGIHGSNMLNMVSATMFEAGMDVNVAAVAAGEAAPVLFTKTFFDNFILMGGSGATLCLLLALLVSNKRGNARNLFKVSILPSLFNINELVLFGFPVVFNPIMLIPFLVVPLVLLCTSSAAMALGLVPYCTQQVMWTTPILFSGVASTGSWTGAALQLVNLVIGAAIYLPFIHLSEQYYSDLLKQNANHLRDTIIEREEAGDTSSLNTPVYQSLHEVIKLLTADLRYALANRKISLYYQPQFYSNGKLYGVESLLRWNHPSLGFLYPPMVLALAKEEDLLIRMGYQIIETAACALERLSQEVRYPIDLAVNILPVQLEDPDFCDNVQLVLDAHNFHGCTLCFEVTEQIALASTDAIQERILRLQKMGIPFHMDDFGMGHSSMIYLQNNEFAAVKLDGSLIRGMMDNPKAQEIISSIQQMSQSLHYDLIAEYVETPEQRDKLDELGCPIHQGYLYSPAVSLPDLELYLHSKGVINQRNHEPAQDRELYL